MTAVHTRDVQVAAKLHGDVIASVEHLRDPSLKAGVLQALGMHAGEVGQAPDAARAPAPDPPRITHMIDVYCAMRGACI